MDSSSGSGSESGRVRVWGTEVEGGRVCAMAGEIRERGRERIGKNRD